MRKRTLSLIISAVLLVALFIPFPRGPYKDGGTREYTALTYKVVSWNRQFYDEVYDATKVYWFPNNFKSIDDLWWQEQGNVTPKFVATVLQIDETSALVEPIVGESELSSSDQFVFSISDLDHIDAQVGSLVEVHYTGVIRESYPAQITALKWEIVNDLRHKEYTAQWLDKETAEIPDYEPFSDIIITEIYSNCFFATPVIPMPYQIKLNGTLSEDWCVGDQVKVTYENVYCDNEKHKIEADFIAVEKSDFTPNPNMAYKPVIYLYPETETEVSVQLLLDGKLTCTYPAYNSGWKVTAAPDGTLKDANGQVYNYLYWEGQANTQWDMTKGFCVKGEDTAAFLEYALDKLGLNRREANEFIVYWLPLMEQNPYNVICFQTDHYTNSARLQIAPTPNTMIRVFMAWYASDSFVELPVQELTAPDRNGFTVVEWGGTRIKLE